jgi:NitT/TauT family transport system substrate-binding protein
MPMAQSRRRFLTTLSAVGAAGLVRAPRALAAEAALETTSVRLPKVLGVCVSPQYAAEELLRGEGFTDIRYVETPAAAVPEAIGQGKLDFGLNYAPLLIPAIDAASRSWSWPARMSAASNCSRRKTSATSRISRAGASGCKTGGRPRTCW